MFIEILEIFSLFLTALMTAYLIRHYIFTMVALKNSLKNGKAWINKHTSYQPKVSILIPARNEEKVIGRILQRMTELTYPKDKMTVVVVDDASTDDTGKIAEEYSTMHNYIKVIHRSMEEGGRGKASALNAGFKHTDGEIIVCFDADYYPQKDILEKITSEFVDPSVGVVQGRITVLNEPKNAITRLVALERIGGYRVDQQARDSLGLITQFGGTVGGIRRDLLEALGGWDELILAEDTDLTFRVFLQGYKVRYAEHAECYEEAVESWRAYWRQRYRWARGHMQCAFKHMTKVLKSNRLNLKEKVDGLLLLNIYFLPVLALCSLVVGVILFSLKSSQLSSTLWTVLPITFYSFVGNFAPFFEVGIGVYMDGRTRAQWLIPLMFFMFFYNILICTKAFIDLLATKIMKRNCYSWAKTMHSGDGNSYIMK
ncbi:MAG: glycosyltransferase family 2 protein [Candidatus Bathyarchaeia archaeon]